MKYLIFIILCLNVISCGPRGMENPGAEAKTYSEKEFNGDSFDRLISAEAKAKGLTLKPDIKNLKNEMIPYVAELPEKIESTEDLIKYKVAIQAEIDAIDAYFVKYDGHFRIRNEDGDIKLKSLSEYMKTRLASFRNSWVQALAELESKEVTKTDKSESEPSTPAQSE